MKKFFIMFVLCTMTLACGLISCSDDDGETIKEYADLVVYGKIFTSESNAIAEAFAVKDGKYIFVGNRDAAAKYINADTKVIDRSGQGLVMAGCTDGHGHNIMSCFYNYSKYVIRMTAQDTGATILDKVRSWAKKYDNIPYIYGFGFDYIALSTTNDFPTRQQLDAILSDVPVYLADGEGHKGIANSYCFEKAGILTPEGKVRDDFKYKQYVVVDEDSMPTGLLFEQAGTYVRTHGCITNDGEDVWRLAVQETQYKLNSMGYTATIEGWANKFGMVPYSVAKNMDKAGELTLNLGMAYEIENLSKEEVDADLQAVFDLNKSNTTRVHTNFIKLFIDGTAETGTGYMLIPAPDGSNGFPIWQPNELEDLTLRANKKGVTMHIHTMGDAAVKEVVDAYEKAYKAGYRLRNQMVHLRNVDEADYDRMAKYDIVASCGALWHRMPEGGEEYLADVLNKKYIDESYPYQSFLNHNVHTSISTDTPATSGSPVDPFGIMEVAVTGTQTFGEANNCPTPYNTEDCARNRADFLRSLTIEGAYQMLSEKTRGSIAVGKWADFIFTNKDVLDVDECPNNQLHEVFVEATYFEGKCVYNK
ncbi:MAG: amidohydrolase family protein [Bacteroidaceae bacterium]|nr:amidohydrolase family protein [Bacteroidaceae bacterium]